MDENSKMSETFTYNYSAGQQEEIKKIREKYVAREESKLEQLKRLDKSATKPGTVTALTVGIISTLIMGFGMCCTMVWAETMFIPGIIIGVAGIGGIIMAYPVYSYITRMRRKKIAPEILRLTEELMK